MSDPQEWTDGPSNEEIGTAGCAVIITNEVVILMDGPVIPGNGLTIRWNVPMIRRSDPMILRGKGEGLFKALVPPSPSTQMLDRSVRRSCGRVSHQRR
jgi:hypothetical protein